MLEDLETLLDARRERMRNLHLLSKADLEDNKESLSKMINQLTMVRREGYMVDKEIRPLALQDNSFCELFEIQRDLQQIAEKERNQYEKDSNKVYYFKVNKVEPPKQKIDSSHYDYVVAVYDRPHGFLTQFFKYENMQDTTNAKTELKKRFAVPTDLKDGDDKNLYLVVMLVANDGGKGRMCKGVGVIKMEDIQSVIPVQISIVLSKEYNISPCEQIQKYQEQTLKRESVMIEDSLKLHFQVSEVPANTLTEEDVQLNKVQIPTLLSPKVNMLNITLEKAKTVGKSMFLDSFGVSILVEVFNSKGDKIKCFKGLDGLVTDHYQSLTSPSNQKCEWQEQLCIDLDFDKLANSDHHHIMFSIYKQIKDTHFELFGFSFLPLFHGNNILSDKAHELFTFKITKNQTPLPSDYLSKIYLFDPDMRRGALKTQNDSSKKFSVSQGDSLVVKTKLESTGITEDIDIRALLDIDVDSNDGQINHVFRNFIQSKVNPNSQQKKILFLEIILEKFWFIMKNLPNQNDNVFHSFIETVHPIVTNRKDFGYVDPLLDDYLMTKFSSLDVFDSFIESFSAFLGDNSKNTTTQPYIMMSIKYIFRFIIRSFELNKTVNPAFSLEPFLALMGELKQFLVVTDADVCKQQRALAFKNLFEVDTINTIVTILPNNVLINILEYVVSARDNKTSTKDCNTFNAVSKAIKSNMFNDVNSQDGLCNIALNLITNQFKKQEDSRGRSNSFYIAFNKEGNAFKERTLELLKDLYEACRKPGDGEYSRKLFIKKVTEKVLPELTSIIPDKDARARFRREKTTKRKTENTNQMHKIEDIMFFTLLNEIDDQIFTSFLDMQDSENFFDHLFKIAQNPEDFSFPDNSFKLRMNSIKYLASFLAKVTKIGLNTITKWDRKSIENFLVAILCLMDTKEVELENFTHEDAQRIKNEFGNMKTYLTKLLAESIRSMTKEAISNLICDEDSKLLENLIKAIVNTHDVEGENNRTILINIVFEIILAEFFALNNNEINESIYFCYSWFITENNGGAIENLNESFFRIIEDYMEKLKMSWQQRPDFAKVTMVYVPKFEKYFKILTTHLKKLTTCFRDVNRAVSIRRSNCGKDAGYFGEITARFNYYKALQEVKKEATRYELVEEKEDEAHAPCRDKCISTLQALYEIFDCVKGTNGGGQEEDEEDDDREAEHDFISAGYTLHQLGELIPWSTERANNQLNINVNIWMAKNDIKESQVLGKGTWSRVKENLRTLAIKKFKDACGFECSVEMMEKSIERYKSEVFDFKELAESYRRLAEIYDFRYDFPKKLEDEEDHQKKKEMQDCRRNIINPEYYKITFIQTPLWLKFLESKMFIYRGNAMLQLPLMWEKLRQWFPGCIIESQDTNIRSCSLEEDNKMVIKCSKVCFL